MKTLVLVTGGSGQLGTDVCRELSRRRMGHIGTSSKTLDITDKAAVERYMAAHRPDTVIHCAAYNHVDLAETQQVQCRRVNVEGTRNIVCASREYGAYMVYISSDYVFNGTKKGEYQTGDEKDPLSVYGRTKSEAEDIVLAEKKTAVIRTSWLFGPGERNFVKAILRAARAGRELKVVNDQVGSPTYTEDLAVLLCEALELRPTGILHATNEGACTRAEFAGRVLRSAEVKAKVLEVPSRAYPSSAQRPLNSRLSKTSLDAAGLHRLPDWEDAAARYLARKI